MHIYSVGIRDGKEHGALNCALLDNLIFVLRAKRSLGTPFGTGKGVMQGDPASPMIFNIVVVAVV